MWFASRLLMAFAAEQVSCQNVLELVNAHLDLTGEASSERDAYFGRVFALGALLRSGRLAAEPKLYGTVVTDLVAYMHKKVYLRVCCCELVCTLLAEVSKETFVEHLAASLQDLLNGEPSAESLAIALTASKFGSLPTLFMGLDKKSLFKHSWTRVFGEDHIASLIPVVQRTAEDLPTLHPVWAGIWAVLASHPTISFQTVWDTLVEQGVLRLSTCGWLTRYGPRSPLFHRPHHP